jgi:hypothetical protein
VILAWGACLIGIAIGVLGCVMLAVDRSAARSGATSRARAQRSTTAATSGAPAAAAAPPDPAGDPAPVTAPPSLRTWALLVGGTSRETLSVLRRLATGIDDAHATQMRDLLRSLSQRFGALADACPPGAGDDVVADLRTAARGARHEADRLDGLVVTGSDRRGFLASLRSLRDAAGRLDRDDGALGAEVTADDATAAHQAASIRPSFA